MPARPLEKNITKAAIAKAKLRYPNILIRKNHGTSFATAGDPDLYGCLNGRAFAIEMKRPGEKPTKLQEQRLEEWKRAGAVTGVAHNEGEALEFLEGSLLQYSLDPVGLSPLNRELLEKVDFALPKSAKFFPEK